MGKIYPYLNFTTGDPMNSASAASTSLFVVSKDPRSGEAASETLRSGEAGRSRRMVSRNGSKWNGLAFLPGDSTCLPRYAGDAPTQDVASWAPSHLAQYSHRVSVARRPSVMDRWLFRRPASVDGK